MKFRHRPQGVENKASSLRSSKADMKSNQLFFPLTTGVPKVILTSSLSLVGALVPECVTISKGTKMMSLFHPEKN